MAADDEILKNTFVSNDFENFEIAAYKLLLALCEAARAPVHGKLLQSLEEEQDMASWIDGHVRDITLRHLSRRDR